MKLTITEIYRSTTDKQGNQLVNKNGKPYERLAFKTDKYDDKWVSGFGCQANKYWKVGDEVDVDIEMVGQYVNFKMPNKLDELEQRIKALESRVLSLEGAEIEKDISEPIDKPNDKPNNDPSEEEINMDDIPF